MNYFKKVTRCVDIYDYCRLYDYCLNYTVVVNLNNCAELKIVSN